MLDFWVPVDIDKSGDKERVLQKCYLATQRADQLLFSWGIIKVGIQKKKNGVERLLPPSFRIYKRGIQDRQETNR